MFKLSCHRFEANKSVRSQIIAEMVGENQKSEADENVYYCPLV